MHANRNKKAVKRVEKGMMKANRIRNLFAVFAIVLTTTIYLWLISLTASKELSILLLKLLKCMEQSVYRLIHLGLRVRCRD